MQFNYFFVMATKLDPSPWNLLKSWMDDNESRKWQKLFVSQIAWRQPSIKMFGRNYLIPRKTAFLANEGINYKYSGILNTGNGWPHWFIPLLERVSLVSGCPFNACLLNLYRNGEDSMGWHSDDEPEVDSSKPISSLSLGHTRKFIFRHRYEARESSFQLMDGDLLIMSPFCQLDWKHTLPKSRKRYQVNDGIRINLTFRSLLDSKL